MPQDRHRLLQRQLKRYVGDIEEIPEHWQAFLSAVNDVYQQADQDRLLMERTLELSSKELLHANSQLQDMLQSVEQQVSDRTTELSQTNDSLAYALDQLQQAQWQLVQAEKMSSLGQVTAGIAHEINNPVTFIQGNLRHVKEYSEVLLSLISKYQIIYPHAPMEIAGFLEDHDVDFIAQDFPKIICSMANGTERITKIVLALRTFSRLDEADLKDTDLTDDIESTLMILNSQLSLREGNSIEISYQRPTDARMIECYPSQMNQVLLNVIGNSIDALNDCKKFTSGVELGAIEPHPFTPEELTYLQDRASPKIWIVTEIQGDRLSIRIIDNGTGIPEQIQPRLFDPFFTTKPVGQGTGLGLSTSHQIITKLHRGKLVCRSRPGWGTVFEIQIPLSQSMVAIESCAITI
jgi:two-component system, NtrC family, sensor kinase